MATVLYVLSSLPNQAQAVIGFKFEDLAAIIEGVERLGVCVDNYECTDLVPFVHSFIWSVGL